MATLTIELPESAFSVLRRSPQEFAKEMRIAAAVHGMQSIESVSESSQLGCGRLGHVPAW